VDDADKDEEKGKEEARDGGLQRRDKMRTRRMTSCESSFTVTLFKLMSLLFNSLSPSTLISSANPLRIVTLITPKEMGN
jgi:hypothetical protein